MKNALLIVDVQQFYLPDLPKGFAKKIKNHMEALQYDVVAFGVFQNTENSNFVDSLKWTKCSSEQDVALPSEFNEYINSDNVFKRNTYSVFKNKGLNTFLKSNKVERLVICGVDTDACVLATAFEAFDLGYHVKVEFSLTYSGNDLEKHARPIMEKSIFSRD